MAGKRLTTPWKSDRMANRFDAGVRAEYQSRDPVTMRAGELERDHASPAASEEHDLMRVSIWQRVEHREGRFFQDHRCAATDTDVRRQHVRYLAHGSCSSARLSVSFAQRGQQHDRVIDAHVLKASVVSPKFLCVWRRSGACIARPTREGYRVVCRPRRTPRGACMGGAKR